MFNKIIISEIEQIWTLWLTQAAQARRHCLASDGADQFLTVLTDWKNIE